ncbi:hypothetical protein ABC347_13225 [Sphingomonas sp. 1P06PA]|uniref:hypothetical protein n=1 Tax=Sphingomonas sp. 1P06PA TaxID=554121 RepID=UPI0039A4E2D9
MGPVYFVMAILGCGDAETACQQVRVVPTTYASADACAAASASMLVANSDIAFPVVMSQCRTANPTAAADAGAAQPKG